MSEMKDGGPAFPVVLDQWDYGHEKIMPKQIAPGLSLRDYFAAVALPVVATGAHNIGEDFLASRNYSTAAFDAYKMADAMLKAREQ